MLLAPAGYGKSLLLARVAQRQAMWKVQVWLSLSETDSVRSFVESFIAALEPYDVPWKTDPVAWVGQLSTGDHVQMEGAVSLMASALLAMDGAERNLIVLDDLHRVEDPDVLHLIKLLMEMLTSGWAFAISTRTKPDLSLDRLSAGGELATIRELQLSLSVDETTQICAQSAPTDARAIWERTKGWPAGIQLALAAGVHGDITNPRQQIDRSAFNFMASEVIDKLPEELRRFLLTVSILPEVSVAFANALTQGENAHLMFDQIEERSLFAVDVGEHERVLKFHDLFRSALQHRLFSDVSINLKGLFLRAASFESNDVRAIEFLIQAGELEAAAERVREITPGFIVEGQADEIERILHSISPVLRGEIASFVYTESLIVWSKWSWAAIAPLMQKAEALWKRSGDRLRAQDAASFLPLAYAGLGDNELAAVHLDRIKNEQLAYPARIRVLVAESWLFMYQGRQDEVVARVAETVDNLRINDAPTYLWQQAQPLPAFVGLPKSREPLMKWVTGALRKSPDTPTLLRGMAQVIRSWLLLRGGDTNAAQEAYAEAQSECSWLHSPPSLAFQLGLLRAQLLAIDQNIQLLKAHLQAMLVDASRNEERKHRSAATGLLLYLGARFSSQAGHASDAARLGNLLLLEPESLTGWISQNALHAVRAMVAEEAGALTTALSCWVQQIELEHCSDLFGQAAEARLHCAAIHVQMSDVAAAEVVLRPLFERCALENEYGLLRMASPSARTELANAKWTDNYRNAFSRQFEVLQSGLVASTRGNGDTALLSVTEPTNLQGLSSRELEVLQRLASGDSNKVIARELSLSPFTVKRHVANILNKLGFDSRGRAAAWFHESQR